MTVHVDAPADKIASFVSLFSEYDCRDLIRNLDVEMREVTIGKLTFPMSRNSSNQHQNCYICSPSTAYIDYAIEETRNFAQHPLLKKTLELMIRGCAPLLHVSGLDEQVQLNNWLISTNSVPELNSITVTAIIAQLTKSYPKSTIVLRSLNHMTDAKSMLALGALGFKFLASRQIYMFCGLSEAGNHRRTVNRDQRMREKNGHTVVPHDAFADADFVRCEALYNMLYLEKYTALNPQYTSIFFKEMHARGVIEFAGVRDAEGVLAAFSGIFVSGDTIAQPFVGYDTTRPQEFGLYRIAMSFGVEYALANNKHNNMSSGAASFKRNRGAKPAIEYMAVYNRHLSFKNRAATAIIQKILKAIGIPIMRRFEL